MKITGVRTIALRGATDDHGWPGGTDPNGQYNTLVEVQTDDGVGGSGLEPERWREKVRKPMLWLGGGGWVEHAISGMDIALWDLLGRAVAQPVSRLLGGIYRDRIKPYASILFDDPPVLAEKLRE